jgi:hypothetical protein
MIETAVTAPPIGASRSEDWYMNPDGSGMQQSLVRGRLIGTTDPSILSSNADAAGAGMVLTAAYLLNPVQVGGEWLRMAKLQGSMVFTRGVPFQIVQPAARSLAWALNRYVWEGIFTWPANPAAIDSGLILSNVQNARVRLAGNVGIGLGNVAGVLTFYTRGPGGFEAVDVSALAGPLGSLNKLALVYRHPAKGRDASVSAYVNDRLAATRTWAAGHKLPVPANLGTLLWPQLCHGTNVTDCWVSNLRYSAGPDVVDL